MRSRFSAYALGEIDHVFRTWHPRTRPDDLTPDARADVDPARGARRDRRRGGVPRAPRLAGRTGGAARAQRLRAARRPLGVRLGRGVTATAPRLSTCADRPPTRRPPGLRTCAGIRTRPTARVRTCAATRAIGDRPPGVNPPRALALGERLPRRAAACASSPGRPTSGRPAAGPRSPRGRRGRSAASAPPGSRSHLVGHQHPAEHPHRAGPGDLQLHGPPGLDRAHREDAELSAGHRTPPGRASACAGCAARGCRRGHSCRARPGAGAPNARRRPAGPRPGRRARRAARGRARRTGRRFRGGRPTSRAARSRAGRCRDGPVRGRLIPGTGR